MVNGAAANDSDNSRIDNLPLDDFNHIMFHSPTCKLVSKAYARLLYNDYLTKPSHLEFNSVPAEILKVPRDQSFADKAVEKLFMNLAKQRFEQRVQPSLQLPKLCGNMYCASVYGALISLICGVDGSTLQGKRIGMYSYGGGLAASFFSVKIRGGEVAGIAERINLQARLDARAAASPAQYLEAGKCKEKQVFSFLQTECCQERHELTHFSFFIQACGLREKAYGQKAYTPSGDVSKIATGSYHLTEVDGSYQRKYSVKA